MSQKNRSRVNGLIKKNLKKLLGELESFPDLELGGVDGREVHLSLTLLSREGVIIESWRCSSAS